MTESLGPEELGLEAALDVLEARPNDLEGRLASGDEAIAAIRRQHIEALTLLAWTLPAQPASVALREKLIGKLQGDETVVVPSLASEPVTIVVPPSQIPSLLHGALDPPALTPAVEKSSHSRVPLAAEEKAGATRAAAALARRAPTPAAPTPAAPMPRARSYAWALPFAALFALAAVGIGWHDRQLDSQLASTREQLAAARTEAQRLTERLGEAGAQSTAASASEASLEQLRGQLAMVTSTGTAVCALKPSRGAAAPAAGGVLYVAPDHKHWYLRAQKLPPPGPGRAYRLWFMVGDKPMPAGTFELVGDEAVMSSPTMPDGTSAAMVTIEPEGSTADRPSGPVALFGRKIAPLS